MRQAGRYMKEYRDLRERHSFRDLCYRPELVAEVTVFAQERLGVDAAILFSDLLVVLDALGMQVDWPEGGPRVGPPIRDASGLARLRPDRVALRIAPIAEGVRATRAALRPEVPLIGFCGAPWTVAAYAVEGAGSRNFVHAKTLMYREPATWAALLDRLVDALLELISAQVEAGCQAVQLFDSWVGALGPADYRDFAAPWTAALVGRFRERHPGIPVIHFGTGTASLLEAMQQAGGDVIGVDAATPLAEARRRLGAGQAVQGNLDPVLLFAEPGYVRARAAAVLDENGGLPGHVFNLGHGILPATPVDTVRALVDFVHEESARRGSAETAAAAPP
jgi:uroporphyrinogen decarboxylase